MATKKRNPMNFERDGSILKSKHYVPAVMRCHELEPTAIKNGVPFSDKTLRTVWREMNQQYNTTTTFGSFCTYMNVAATNDALWGRWKKYLGRNGEMTVLRNFCKVTF